MSGCTAEPLPEPAQGPVLYPLAEYLRSRPAPEPEPAQLQIPEPPRLDPGARALADRILRAAVEILGRRRPARQLASLVVPQVLRHLVELQAAVGHLRPRVHRVVTTQPSADALEAVAVVVLSTGVRAIAARFDRRDGGSGATWLCTALHLRLTAGDLLNRRR